ncbi:HD domain-containing protein [Candidatus Woesearchaeota archaeon]|nr:HD domain-containing protein [Candidatus Woesearchaeota archaeon]
MDEIKKLHRLYALKEVDRYGVVKHRRESTAEHVYSCLVLAQYFLTKTRRKLDQNKVMKMLLYHDIVEIESGDVYFLDEKKLEQKKKIENKAFERLKKQIPSSMTKEIESLWREFEENKTKEAKFCQAIDKFDPAVHFLEKKEDWVKQKLTEKIVREKKDPYLKDFPEIMAMWNKIIAYAKKNGYFVEK